MKIQTVISYQKALAAFLDLLAMKKFLPVILTVLFAAASSSAQAPQPAPKPTAPGDDDVVKISTNLIQVDITVTDAKGKVITDLKPEEVEIYENGEKEKITNFSFISSVKTSTEKTAIPDKSGIPVPQQDASARADQTNFRVGC